MRERVTAQKSTLELREQAVLEGVGSLRRAGVDAIRQGITTVEEVLQNT